MLLFEKRLEAGRESALEKPDQLFADLIGMPSESELNAPRARKMVDDERDLRSLRAFDQKGRLSLFQCAR